MGTDYLTRSDEGKVPNGRRQRKVSCTLGGNLQGPSNYKPPKTRPVFLLDGKTTVNAIKCVFEYDPHSGYIAVVLVTRTQGCKTKRVAICHKMVTEKDPETQDYVRYAAQVDRQINPEKSEPYRLTGENSIELPPGAIPGSFKSKPHS